MTVVRNSLLNKTYKSPLSPQESKEVIEASIQHRAIETIKTRKPTLREWLLSGSIFTG